MKLYLGPLFRLYAHIDPDPDVVRDVVLAWRRALSKQLPHALAWDESPTSPFDFTEVREWPTDGPDQLVQPDIWLPGAQDLLIEVLDLDEREVTVGSSAELLQALQNARHPHLARLARRSVEFGLPLAKVSR